MTIRVPPNYQNYCYESAATIMLCFQLFSAQLQMKNSVRRIVSASHHGNTDDSHLQTYCREAMYCATVNRHLGLSAKEMGHKGGQR